MCQMAHIVVGHVAYIPLSYQGFPVAPDPLAPKLAVSSGW